MTMTRRSFLKGIGAAIVLSVVPSMPVYMQPGPEELVNNFTWAGRWDHVPSMIDDLRAAKEIIKNQTHIQAETVFAMREKIFKLYCPDNPEVLEW